MPIGQWRRFASGVVVCFIRGRPHLAGAAIAASAAAVAQVVRASIVRAIAADGLGPFPANRASK